MDKLINEKIISDLNYNQHGFRSSLGTEPNILRLIMESKKLLEKRKLDKKSVPGVPALIFIDFKQAFDQVDWDILFNKLKNYNFPTSLINAIKTLYFSTYASGSSLNDSAKIMKGVIQGG